MKKLIPVILMLVAFSLNAQQSANRFFYELTFRPKTQLPDTDKVMTILDITKDKSIYQDYTVPAQDSVVVAAFKEMEKTKTFKDLSKMITMPKFSYKVTKAYPTMAASYTDRISRNMFGYTEQLKFNWNILPQKEKIGEYDTQKATTEFGGRKWTAWFTTAIPFSDGPYKFSGLPGLIVKIEDDAKDYSWLLKGNKKIENYSEETEAEKLNAKFGMSNKANMVTREKFEKAYEVYKADPLAEMRPQMTPELMGKKMPGSDKTIGEFLKEQEKIAKDFFGANNNPIEKAAPAKKK